MRLAIPLACLLALPLAAAAEEVDVELVLAVDVSRSMAPSELEIQRRGYAEALRSETVQAAIRAGMIGKVALTYYEWAGTWSNRVVVPWTVVGTAAEANAFADALEADFPMTMSRTSISAALTGAAELIETSGHQGLRRVIDISGDGPNNEGAYVTDARAQVLAKGIVVNGLPLMTRDGNFGGRWQIDNLDEYYRDCVIGGPGSFMIPVDDWAEFAAAVRQKLVLEIAGLVPAEDGIERIWRAQAPEGADCRIGEKIRAMRIEDF